MAHDIFVEQNNSVYNDMAKVPFSQQQNFWVG
jgi:hypothetical protein